MIIKNISDEKRSIKFLCPVEYLANFNSGKIEKCKPDKREIHEPTKSWLFEWMFEPDEEKSILPSVRELDPKMWQPVAFEV